MTFTLPVGATDSAPVAAPAKAKRGRPLGRKTGAGKGGPHRGSRKAQMLALKVGDSVIFTGTPGQTSQDLMASIASAFRAGENTNNRGLTQTAGLVVFEGELPRPAIRVTRFKEAQE